MHFLSTLLRIKGLYMFRALLGHLQEAIKHFELPNIAWCAGIIVLVMEISRFIIDTRYVLFRREAQWAYS
jgi:hypothetical protein